MKNKTLALITAALITAAALALTASLSLLDGSAITESAAVSTAEGGTVGTELEQNANNGENYPVIEDEPKVDAPIDEIPAYDPEAALPEAGNAPLDEESPIVEAPTVEYPDSPYVTGDAKTVYIDGDDVGNGVVIDVYSHKTGKLVGQLAFTSEAISGHISELKSQEFKPENELWIEKNVSCVPLPEGDYRIEVYAGSWFSYTYGVSGIFELTQCTLTFSGGEKLTGYIDSLISGLIADIEAGKIEAPAPESAVSKLIYRGLEGYWEGYYVEELDSYVPAAGRFCERFPYAE